MDKDHENYERIRNALIYQSVIIEATSLLVYEQLYLTAQQEGAARTVGLAKSLLEYSQSNLRTLRDLIITVNASGHASGRMKMCEHSIYDAINGIEKVLGETSKKE